MKAFVLCLMGLYFQINIVAQQTASARKEAVYVIGADMPDQYTYESEDAAEVIAFLKANNYKVHTFFYPDTDWEKIKKASLNASIFIYKGHGVYHSNTVFGGIAIEEIIDPEQISSELKFNNKPIVVFHQACGGAGSSANDETDIGLATAKQRVINTFLPFYKAGASAYYATNYTGGLLTLFQSLKEGNNLIETFENDQDYYHLQATNEPLQDERISASMSIGVLTGEGIGNTSINRHKNGRVITKTIPMPKQYSIAFIGDPAFKITEKPISSLK